ncbi:MAG TPA: tetratricopeptide repeat protein [Polyangia bacterium]|nr:tetratricopeptide repeat protein [Polyangia bacterium]
MKISFGLAIALSAGVAHADPVVVERSSSCPTKNEKARDAYNRGYGAQKRGELDAAETAYKEAIALDARYCDAMDNLGQVYRARHDDVNAVLWYRKSIAISPNNQVAHQSLAAAYVRAARYDDALGEYDILIKLDPNDAEGPYGKAAVLWTAKRYREALVPIALAETLYAKAKSPLVADAQFIEGLCHAELGEWLKARAVLEPLESARENDKRWHFALGRAWVLGEPRDAAKAKAHLERARSLGAAVPDELMKKTETP